MEKLSVDAQVTGKNTNRSRDSVGEVFSVLRIGTGAYGCGPILTQQVWLEYDDELRDVTRSTAI